MPRRLTRPGPGTQPRVTGSWCRSPPVMLDSRWSVPWRFAVTAIDPVLSAHFAVREPSGIRIAGIRFEQRATPATALNTAIGIFVPSSFIIQCSIFDIQNGLGIHCDTAWQRCS